MSAGRLGWSNCQLLGYLTLLICASGPYLARYISHIGSNHSAGIATVDQAEFAVSTRKVAIPFRSKTVYHPATFNNTYVQQARAKRADTW